MGLVRNENSNFIGPLGNVQGTGFGKILYGRGNRYSAAAFWPVPLISETELKDPDDDGAEARLENLLPRSIAYRSGPTTEMVSKRWHQTPVTIRRIRDHQQPNVLLEEFQSMSRLRHPGLMLLLGVNATKNWESIQLIYEPIYSGSLHQKLHKKGTSISLTKRLLILQQVCDALLFLHSKRLLHCSVSSHAVHLVSTSRAKLGCLETLIEDNELSKRVYRKVPSSHWEWMAPWIAPECSRGELVTTLSDLYSFCCLVWETYQEKLPESHLDHPRMLPLGPAIPLHVGGFLKLGLQPELSERSKIDLKEIYCALRRVGVAVSDSQPKKSSPFPVSSLPVTFANLEIQPYHGKDGVKENGIKKRCAPAPPSPRGKKQNLTIDSSNYCDAENDPVPVEAFAVSHSQNQQSTSPSLIRVTYSTPVPFTQSKVKRFKKRRAPSPPPEKKQNLEVAQPSALDKIGEAELKLSPTFLSDAKYPAKLRIPSFFTNSKQGKELVATMTAIFNYKGAINQTYSILKQRSASSSEEHLVETNVDMGETLNEYLD